MECHNPSESVDILALEARTAMLPVQSFERRRYLGHHLARLNRLELAVIVYLTGLYKSRRGATPKWFCCRHIIDINMYQVVRTRPVPVRRQFSYQQRLSRTRGRSKVLVSSNHAVMRVRICCQLYDILRYDAFHSGARCFLTNGFRLTEHRTNTCHMDGRRRCSESRFV